MVDDVAGGEFAVDILDGDTGLDHEDKDVVGEVGDLIDRFLFILSLCGDYDLGTLFAHLFKYFIKPFFKKIGGIRAFLFIGLSAFYKLIKELIGKDRRLVFVLKDLIAKAGGRT